MSIFADDLYIDPDIDIGNIVIPVPPPTPVENETDANGSVVSGDGSSSAAQSLAYAEKGIIRMAWAQEPYRTLWAVRSDGLLLGMTFRKDNEVLAWHRHPMRNGAVEDVTVIPNPQTGQAQVWLVLRRIIGGQTKRYIEIMTPPHVPTSDSDTAGYIFVDSSLTYSGDPADEISGLDHLDGQTVSIWADGSRHPDRVVTDGAVLLDREASTVHIGLQSDAYIRTLPAKAGAANGYVLGKTRAVSRIRAELYHTIGGKAGQSLDRLDDLNQRQRSDLMDRSPAMFNGTADVAPDRAHDRKGQFYIVQDIPGPMTILALMPELDGTDF